MHRMSGPMAGFSGHPVGGTEDAENQRREHRGSRKAHTAKLGPSVLTPPGLSGIIWLVCSVGSKMYPTWGMDVRALRTRTVRTACSGPCALGVPAAAVTQGIHTVAARALDTERKEQVQVASRQELRMEPPSFAPPAKPSASDQVYATLKQEVVWGEIEPGTLLSESKLAARFGVSRTPVREALTMLASDGLITTLSRRGHLVRTVSFSEILGAFRLRELLEVEAAGLAAQRVTDHDLAYLRQLAENRDGGDVPAKNREFHMTIARASGNRVLAEFIERLLMLMQSVLIKDPHLRTWTREGMQVELSIIDALASRDEEAAREAMGGHIRNTLATILK